MEAVALTAASAHSNSEFFREPSGLHLPPRLRCLYGGESGEDSYCRRPDFAAGSGYRPVRLRDSATDKSGCQEAHPMLNRSLPVQGSRTVPTLTAQAPPVARLSARDVLSLPPCASPLLPAAIGGPQLKSGYSVLISGGGARLPRAQAK